MILDENNDLNIEKEKKDLEKKDLEKKMYQSHGSKNLRKSHLFQVVLEFYVRQIELSFSFN